MICADVRSSDRTATLSLEERVDFTCLSFVVIRLASHLQPIPSV